MVQDSTGQQEFERKSRNHLTVFADVIKQLYSPHNHYPRLNDLIAKVVPQQCLFNHVSPRCTLRQEHKGHLISLYCECYRACCGVWKIPISMPSGILMEDMHLSASYVAAP